MESDESDKCTGQAGSSRHQISSFQDMSAPDEEQTKHIHKRGGDEDGVKCETDNERNSCNYESDASSERSESSDEEESDEFSENLNETDNELDDDNGNDENGNIKEDEWESMEEDDDDGKEENNVDAGIDSDSSNDHSERCPICLNRFIGQTVGTPESCSHCFCLECLLEWSKNINTCPVDRKVYYMIFSRSELGGRVIDKIPVDTPEQEDEPDDEDDVTYCEVCGECDREDTLLLCDFCDDGYHCECLVPPLDHVPVVEWYCPRCISAGNVEVDNEENTSVTSSHASRLQRVIARTRASESVRHRIQQRRITTGRTRSRSTTSRKRRKVRRRKNTTKKSKTRKRSTKKGSGIKQKARKRLTLKPRRRRRRLVRRKRKTRRAIATARPLVAPTIRKRIADRIGMTAPVAGQTLPQMKRHCPPRSLNARRYDGGVPIVSLFGHRDELDVVDEDYENSTGGVATVQSVVTSYTAVAHHARLTNKQALTLERRIMPITPLTATENIDILGNIIEEQKVLYKKSQDISIQRNGFLKVKSPNDGLEQKQETESSEEHGKTMHESSEKEEGSKGNNDVKDTVQSTSSNVNSSVDMFDSDNNDNNATNTELPHGARHTDSKENKSRKQRRNILNYNAMQLYSDVEDDEENEALWCPPKKKKNTTIDKRSDCDKAVQEHNPGQNPDVGKVTKSERTDSKLHDTGDDARNVPTEECDKEQSSLRTNSDSCILQRILEEKKQNVSELMPEESDNTCKKKDASDEKERKDDSGEETADDFTDIAPRVNISVLPKIPKIKREKDEKQEEEVNSESGRHSVLSKVDEGSQETRWNKLSRFSRDKNSSDNKSDRSFSEHGPRSKQDNFRWSNDRNNRDNRHWRDRDDGDDFRDRRHGGRQREHDRWEKPWKSDQRNRFDNYNFGNDNRKKFSRDNRSGNFRDRKDFPRFKPGNMKEYSRDKDRNVGGKNNSGERDGMYRDIPNRNFKKFSYDGSEMRKGPMNQGAKFEGMDREMECGITTMENEAMNSEQRVNSSLAQSAEWGEKQSMPDMEARENFWKMQDEGRHQSILCDNADGNHSGGYRKLRSPSPPSPPENESYDPFDPTESPVHKPSTNHTDPSLDIPLPDRNDGPQIMKSLDNIEDKPMILQPPPRFSQPSFDQSATSGFVPRGTLPNVHIPPPNFVMPSVHRPPFSNMVPQPNVQPFNWSALPPPPAILVPPMMRGNFLPPPLPPRVINPQCGQPQMGCLPPHGPPPGPPPGPLPVMTPRGSGPFVPNLPPPPMHNIPPQVALTNIAHPPPPPPPPSHMITNSVQNTAPPVIPSHAPHNSVPPRPLFIPPTTSGSNPLQDTSLPPVSNQAATALCSPLAISSSTSAQNTDISNTVTTAVVPITSAVVQPISKKNDVIPTSSVATASEFPKKLPDIETTNQSTAPSDVIDIVDMEVDSPFSPTNSPIDFDDVSIASSSEKSTPSPIGREVILSSPRPKFAAAKHAVEADCPKSSTPLKASTKPANDLSITENSKSSKIISCGQSLLEEVWAKHILSDSTSKGSYLDAKKKPIEKVRVVRDASAKEALKLEGSSFKMDEDQLKILDEIPSSAVEMQVKEKYMKKLNRQERVIEEVKLALKPYYNRRDIDKEEYKEILRKCVPKICHNRSGSIIPKKVKTLVEAYVEKFSYHRKKGKDRPFPNT